MATLKEIVNRFYCVINHPAVPMYQFVYQSYKKAYSRTTLGVNTQESELKCWYIVDFKTLQGNIQVV